MSQEPSNELKETKEQKAARKAAKAAKKAAKASAEIQPTESSTDITPPSVFVPVASSSTAPAVAESSKKSKKRKAANDGPVPGPPHEASEAQAVTGGPSASAVEFSSVDPNSAAPEGDNDVESEQRANKKRRKDKTKSSDAVPAQTTSEDVDMETNPTSAVPSAASAEAPAVAAPTTLPPADTPSSSTPLPASTDDKSARKAAKQAKRDKKTKKQLAAAQARPDPEAEEVEGSKQVENGASGKDEAEKKEAVMANKEEEVKKVEVEVKRSGDPEDPVGDDRLSEKAKECILYAYTYKTSFPTWKFSKPKQNWLQKHVYDGEAIPEEYVDLIIAYLNTIQGNAKKHIIEDAKKIQAQAAPAITEPSTEEAAVETEDSAAADAEPTPTTAGQADAATEGISEAKDSEDGVEKARLQRRAERAGKVLAVLEGVVAETLAM